MTTEQKAKVKVLEDFLNENRMAFFRGFKSKKHDVKAQLYVPMHRIVVKVSEGKAKDDEYYLKVKHLYHPLFIRDEETEAFILEKMQNLIIDLMKRKQERLNRKKSK